jgi:hypothetical protein
MGVGVAESEVLAQATIDQVVRSGHV